LSSIHLHDLIISAFGMLLAVYAQRLHDLGSSAPT
jgi:hypothetical protein